MITIYIRADEAGNILEWGTSLSINGVEAPSVQITDLDTFLETWLNYKFIDGQLILREEGE